VEDEMLTYKPWHTSTGMAGIEYSETIEVAAGIFELTTGRLMANHRPILSLYNKETGEKVFSIPVVDYALLVKGYYNQNMTDQEYLDRQDEYNMTFFLDEDGDWLSASIIVNSWRVVLNNDIL
jgi:hypothetical protein